jgi:ELP3 family radical SAM enzyme/protein acetyltransferase
MSTVEKIVTDLATKNYSTYDQFYRIMRKAFNAHKQAPLAKSTLISIYRQLIREEKIKPNRLFERMLIKNAVRTLSGVTVITVLTKPFPCPGKCVFCPTEPNMPKSYLSNEPAAQRAVRNKFSPFRQVQKRIEALELNGHQVDKIELIVLGGTWSSYPRKYQRWFITQCFYAANIYNKSKRAVKNLVNEQKTNEKAKYRIIGVTLETRSDHVVAKEVKHLRELGCTRVQLGIQHTDNRILEFNRRGETVEDDIKATKLLKTAGFKVDYHLMPDLPGSTPAKDLAMIKRVFNDQDLQPDQIKIYPCVVNEYAQLYHWYKSGKYKPYPEKDLISLLLKIKKLVPPYVRINRLIRDIPEESIIAGNDVTNLRQYLQQELIKKGTPCCCIRCRESRANTAAVNNAKLKIRSYQASDGTEHFLSYESADEKIIYAFLRLRFNKNPEKNFISELKGAALVRELHVYGLMLPVQRRVKDKAQHTGLGKKLMQSAEQMARRASYKKIAVISGIGVRDYYRKLGYRQKGSYMLKDIIAH